MKSGKLKFLIAAGGTGGHLFPALALIDNLKRSLDDNCDFIFVGNYKRIEGSIIPKLGYKLVEIDIFGLKGLFRPENLLLPYKIIKSVNQVLKLIKQEQIIAVIATGAYLSYPPGIAAYYAHVPLFLMESNIRPGKVIRKLSAKANLIFTSFEETRKYFNSKLDHKIINTGNPIRMNLMESKNKGEARVKFGLDTKLPTILVIGGSLGAISINKAIEHNLENFAKSNLQLIWQTGKNYKLDRKPPSNVALYEFIDNMADAYAASDIVVARAGATTVAEITALGLPSILIPLPNAANSEQHLNAKFLESKNACILLNDSSAREKIFDLISNIIYDSKKLSEMADNSKSLGRLDAGERIAEIIISYLNK